MERKLIAAAVTSALAVPMAAQAVEEFAVSGHVNRAVIVMDQDGYTNGGLDQDGKLQHVDSNASETRFRFTGSEELDSGLTVGVNLELGRPGNWRTRHAHVYFDGAGGRLTLGQASAATDGMAHARLGGPSWLGGVTNWCSYVAQGPACPSNDGNRIEVLRYDTPSLGPVGIAASTGDNEYWDARLTVAGSMGEAGYDFRLGYIPTFDGDDGADAGDILTTSGAVSFGQGTAIAAAWSKDDMPDSRTQEHEYFYAEIDHSYGDGSVGVYWKKGEISDSGPGADVEGTLWGIGLGHNIGGGATAYAGFRRMETDNVADGNLYITGMRVTFN